jgi:hypothetical protein
MWMLQHSLSGLVTDQELSQKISVNGIAITTVSKDHP